MKIRRLLGLDIAREKYAFAKDAAVGHISAQRVADTWVKTTCGYCSVGCGMQIGVREGKVVTSRGDQNHSVNRGKLCPKGLAEHYVLNAENRARYPHLRGKNGLERISWEEALGTMAGEFRRVAEKYGPQAIGVISTGQLVTEEFYTLGKLVQLGLGTSNFDGNTTLCMSTAVSGYKRSFGSDGPPGAYEDFTKAEVILLIGANIAENHPILCQHLDANTKKTLIVADPRVSKTAMMADIFLPVKPRSDLALVNGIAHILIRDGLIDREYIDRHTNGFDELCRFLDKYDPEYVSGITGLSTELLERVAHLYGKANGAFIGWTMGVNHSSKGTETVNAINNLALLTGNVGRVGGSPFSITGQCNAMGTRETGFTSSLPGYRKFENETDREELASLWGVAVERIPTQRGLAYPDIISAVLRKKIRALWIIATNPLVSFPNIDVLKQALGELEFLVVQDCFHPTPTTVLAHMVLPAAAWGEKEGTYTNSERRVSKVNAAVPPPGEALSDFDIFLRLAGELGCREELFPGWKEPRDAFEEWKRVSEGRLCDYSGMTYEVMEAYGGIQWPYPKNADTAPTAARRLYTDGVFETADGRAKLICAEWEPFPEQPSQDYPFVLNTGRTVEHWHTRTKTGAIAILEQIAPRAWLEMNPVDAKRLMLRPHDLVDIVSTRGRVRRVELRVTEVIAPGQVFVPFHFAEWNINEVTQDIFDPISREPNYKQCAVRVEKAASA
ncbi:molybdopterin oxidoreductase family protein [Paracidobacterium acidisoli]|uniref:Nitrate reductase n=1 Tax=Paracidobacterium acidisoli TaxID=2303751 RepID=A0A372IUP4_9BACT|nr:nitrate reductase [Paracidobacterium acidisoli]MBT9330089.1 nitrate reductase [Paracidobacterium acidisoli]